MLAMITEQARMAVIVVQLVHKDSFEQYSKSGEECTEFVVFQQFQRAKPYRKPWLSWQEPFVASECK